MILLLYLILLSLLLWTTTAIIRMTKHINNWVVSLSMFLVSTDPCLHWVVTVCLGVSQLQSLLKLTVVKWSRIFAPLRSQRELLSAKFTQHLSMPYPKIYQLLKMVLHNTYLLLKTTNAISLKQNNVVTNNQEKMKSTITMVMKASLNMNHQYQRNVQSQTTHNIHGLFPTSSRTSPYLLASALPWTCSNYMLLIQRVWSNLLSTLPLAQSFLIPSGQTSLLVMQSILMLFFQDTTQLPTMTSESNLLEKLKLSLEQWLQAKSSQAPASGQSLGTRLLMQHHSFSPLCQGTCWLCWIHHQIICCNWHPFSQPSYSLWQSCLLPHWESPWSQTYRFQQICRSQSCTHGFNWCSSCSCHKNLSSHKKHEACNLWNNNLCLLGGSQCHRLHVCNKCSKGGHKGPDCPSSHWTCPQHQLILAQKCMLSFFILTAPTIITAGGIQKMISISAGSCQPQQEPWTIKQLVHEQSIALGFSIDNSSHITYTSALNSYSRGFKK